MTLISHEHRFVFIKTAKTAGTSIELALESICGPGDICAPITQKQNPRPGEESFRKRNHKGVFVPRLIKHGTLNNRFLKDIRDNLKLAKFTGHMPADEVRWRMGKKRWNDYFKFTVERNPWDKTVSAYFFAQRHIEERIPFEDWLQQHIKNNGTSFYLIDDEVAVDHIMRFENLQEDFAQTLGRIGVSSPPELPRSKAEFRPKKAHYREVHTDFTRKFVAERYARVIELFGYTFD